jgi:hypothetical protein
MPFLTYKVLFIFEMGRPRGRPFRVLFLRYKNGIVVCLNGGYQAKRATPFTSCVVARYLALFLRCLSQAFPYRAYRMFLYYLMGISPKGYITYKARMGALKAALLGKVKK